MSSSFTSIMLAFINFPLCILALLASQFAFCKISFFKWPAVTSKFQSSYSKRLFNRIHHSPLTSLKDLVFTSRSRQPRLYDIDSSSLKRAIFWHCSPGRKQNETKQNTQAEVFCQADHYIFKEASLNVLWYQSASAWLIWCSSWVIWDKYFCLHNNSAHSSFVSLVRKVWEGKHLTGLIPSRDSSILGGLSKLQYPCPELLNCCCELHFYSFTLCRHWWVLGEQWWLWPFLPKHSWQLWVQLPERL